MKIADLRATPVNIPLRAPYRFAYGSIASLTKTVVEVVTDEGVVGLGEIAGGDCAAAALAFRDRLVGVDILDLNAAEAAACRPRGTRRGTTRSATGACSAASRWRCGTRAAGPKPVARDAPRRRRPHRSG